MHSFGYRWNAGMRCRWAPVTLVMLTHCRFRNRKRNYTLQWAWETSYHIYIHSLCWAFLPLQTLGIRRLKRCWDIQNFQTHPYGPHWRSKHPHIFPTKNTPKQKNGLGSKVQFRNSTRRKPAAGDSEIWQLSCFKSACGKPGLLTQPWSCRIVQGPSSTMKTTGPVVVVEIVPHAFQ